MDRNYDSVRDEVAASVAPGASRDERMRLVTDRLWEHLGSRGTAWLGFYVTTPDMGAMTLAVCRPKPACSPIGLHGVCGKAWRERAPQVVDDVHALGEAHIVCDPSNLSEVVVPCLDGEGQCWGVLDLDSARLSAYTRADAEGLRKVLVAAGLTA